MLITGVPGMGKTTIGNYLREKKGFKHIDFEDSESLKRFATNTEQFIRQELSQDNIVITWGFVPVENQINLVLYLRNIGLKIVWLDGNRLAAFREYLEAGRPEYPFYVQMTRIEESNVIARIKPKIVNTFNSEGRFKELESIANEILEE